MNRPPGRFLGEGGGRGVYQSQIYPVRSNGPSTQQLGGWQRRASYGNFGDAMRAQAMTDGKNDIDGSGRSFSFQPQQGPQPHGRPGPQSPQMGQGGSPDGSNTARIIARRRALDDSNRSGRSAGRSVRSANSAGRGRGRGRGRGVGASFTGGILRGSGSIPGSNRLPPPTRMSSNASTAPSVASAGSASRPRERKSSFPDDGPNAFGSNQQRLSTRRMTIGNDGREGSFMGMNAPPARNDISGSRIQPPYPTQENKVNYPPRSNSFQNLTNMANRMNARLINSSQQSQRLMPQSGLMSSGTSRGPSRVAMMEHQMRMLEDQIEQRQQLNAHNMPSNIDNSYTSQRGEKLKLYDELASISDPKLEKWIEEKGGTASTMPSEGHGVLPTGNHEHYYPQKHRICSLKATAGFVVLVLALGGTIAALYISKPWESAQGEDAIGIDSNASISVITFPTISPKGNASFMDPPPVDIEGRCSPSNLPGSLSECLAACLPSSCCYPDYTGESCYDENNPESKEACLSYRPYCDVFYNSWEGATQGVLRVVPDEMANACSGKGKRVGKTTRTGSFVKRVRGHFIRTVSNGLSRQLQTAEETCLQYCTAAECCSASIVTDPEFFGLDLSPSKVYTNISSGEYVMTNCQESNRKNVDICSQYETFCTKDGFGQWGMLSTFMPSRRPSFSSPTSSDIDGGTVLVPIGSATPSLLMEAGDSMPNLPTQTPPSSSNTLPLKPTPKPVLPEWVAPPPPTRRPTTAGGTPSTSQPTLPYNLKPPVTVPTTPTVTALITAPPFSAQNQNSTSIPTPTNSTLTSSSSTPPVIPIVPASTKKIQQACSNISSDDAAARSKCIGACQEGLCCFAAELGYDWIESCYVGNEEVCSDYSSCLALKEDGAGSDVISDDASIVDSISETPSTSPSNSLSSTSVASQATTVSVSDVPAQDDGPPVQDLSALCSREIISSTDGLNQCVEACSLGLCCGATDERSCYETHTDTCQLYVPCNAAYDILLGKQSGVPPAADANIGVACSFESLAQTGSSECMRLCEPGACCSDDSCLTGSDVTPAMVDELNGICVQYSLCKNLDGLPQPPSNIAEICSDSTSESCTFICSAASCCFLDQVSSCFTNYEAICNSYMPYCVSTSAQNSTPSNPPSSQSNLQPAANLTSPQPSPPTASQPATPSEDTGTTADTSIPPPPSDLTALCTVGPSVFCNQVCIPAKCCFEASTELNCFAQNQICREYAACSVIYEN